MMGYVSRCGGIFVSVIFHRVLRGNKYQVGCFEEDGLL